mgnify:CR=1 FL=1
MNISQNISRLLCLGLGAAALVACGDNGNTVTQGGTDSASSGGTTAETNDPSNTTPPTSDTTPTSTTASAGLMATAASENGATSRTIVVLPDPLDPTSATDSPGAIARSMPSEPWTCRRCATRRLTSSSCRG